MGRNVGALPRHNDGSAGFDTLTHGFEQADGILRHERFPFGGRQAELAAAVRHRDDGKGLHRDGKQACAVTHQHVPKRRIVCQVQRSRSPLFIFQAHLNRAVLHAVQLVMTEDSHTNNRKVQVSSQSAGRCLESSLFAIHSDPKPQLQDKERIVLDPERLQRRLFVVHSKLRIAR